MLLNVGGWLCFTRLRFTLSHEVSYEDVSRLGPNERSESVYSLFVFVIPGNHVLSGACEPPFLVSPYVTVAWKLLRIKW